MFETGGQRACEAVRRLGVGPAKCAGRRFSQAECEQGFGLLHGGYDLIDDWNWNSLGDTLGQSRQRRPRQNQNVGLVLLHRAHRKFDQKVFLFSPYLGDFTERAVEHADAGTSFPEPVGANALLVPGAKRLRERHQCRSSRLSCCQRIFPVAF